MARVLSGRQEGASAPDNPSSLKIWVPKRREEKRREEKRRDSVNSDKKISK
jgi:hypothetical protein